MCYGIGCCRVALCRSDGSWFAVWFDLVWVCCVVDARRGCIVVFVVSCVGGVLHCLVLLWNMFLVGWCDVFGCGGGVLACCVVVSCCVMVC